MATYEFLLACEFFVYQGIIILINLAYQNKIMHKWLQLISSKEDIQSNHVLCKLGDLIDDKITGKTGNEMRQARTHIWAPDTSPSLNLCKI
jgi:hypothetical protein